MSTARLNSFVYLIWLGLLFSSCTKDLIITPDDGYKWPSYERAYWPTEDWQTTDPVMHNIDTAKLEQANDFAENDHLTRALLVVKDGYLVYENYYGDGGINQSTNLWSVTKSVVSALVGITLDQGDIQSTSQLMQDLMPEYQQFNEITLHHVLTMTTGLNWNESGPLWVDWILSPDWVAHALSRGHFDDPGNQFYYSSGNSQFLTALVNERTGRDPGQFAKEFLFDPLGIPFEIFDSEVPNTNWLDYKKPLYQSWHENPKGIETAGFGLFLTARDMAKFGYLFLNRGKWNGQTIISEDWVIKSIKDYEKGINDRYSYGYHWWLTFVDGHPSFLASGFGGQIIGIVPSLDLVVVLKYEADNPVHPESGTSHDDMYLFELVVKAIDEE